jgi:hypothetical protein
MQLPLNLKLAYPATWGVGLEDGGTPTLLLVSTYFRNDMVFLTAGGRPNVAVRGTENGW